MKRGYTLIEVMVVITIISLLSVIFLANYRGQEKQLALRRATYKLAQDIRRVEALAMSAKRFNNSFPKGGYGIYLKKNTNSYVLFANCNTNNSYEALGSAPDCASATIANPYPEKVEEIFLEKGTTIADLNYSTGDVSTIIFFPPDPIITVNPAPPAGQMLTITLTSEGRSMRINFGLPGLISVN